MVVYPFMTTSIPSILFVVGLLIILAYDASSSNPWRAIYKAIGTLV
jgi:hypothetical protein